MQCTLLGRGWKISFRNHCQTPTRTVKRHCRGLQSERAIKEHISKNASTLRFWITFQPVQGAAILEGLVVTPSSISDGISWCLLCFSPVFVVYPSLKQIVDCGRLLLLLHWLHSNLPIAFRCPVNRIFQPYPPKAVAFSNIFQMFLPFQQNILGLSIPCCFFKYFLFLHWFVYVGVLFLLRLAKVKIDGPLLENSLPSQPCQRLRMRISLFIQQALYSQK